MPDRDALTVLLVRHAEPVAPGTSGFDEFTRPLTTKGMRDAEQLREIHSSTRIDAAYSSPYLRARQTIEPIARARGLAIATIEDLRERMLSLAELPDWKTHLKRTWEDFDYAPPGGETGRIAQARVVRVLDTIASRHSARHRDPRQPRQSDRARAARIHAERRLQVLGIDPDAGGVHADSGRESRWRDAGMSRAFNSTSKPT